jgi:hypothetical protein
MEDTFQPGGDLPANHPLVLEALKGIISGPISELRSNVDNLIVNSSTSLSKGMVNYDNILPNYNNSGNQSAAADYNTNIINSIMEDSSIVNYVGNVNQHKPVQSFSIQETIKPVQVNNSQVDRNQLELPLFKQAEVSDIHKKLFDLEKKLDIIIKHVKNNKN